MTPDTWPCPLAGGGSTHEYALAFDQGREARLLIVPALFDEANRMRRLTVETMRRLDTAGIDSYLPDLPGCNESLQLLEVLESTDWRDATEAATRHFGATHVLGIRGGAMFTPSRLPGWHYAPVKGASIMRQLLRSRIIASRETGREETQQELLDRALTEGIELAGYSLGPDFVRQFQAFVPGTTENISEIEQSTIGGSGLWLRAEPDENHEQADALAAVISAGIRS